MGFPPLAQVLPLAGTLAHAGAPSAVTLAAPQAQVAS
jgi:hypothetical protein